MIAGFRTKKLVRDEHLVLFRDAERFEQHLANLELAVARIVVDTCRFENAFRVDAGQLDCDGRVRRLLADSDLSDQPRPCPDLVGDSLMLTVLDGRADGPVVQCRQFHASHVLERLDAVNQRRATSS